MNTIPYGYIYKIKNLINNKIYIGQTIKTNPLNRIKGHFKDAKNNKINHKFYNAISKYGKSNFLCSIICICYTNQKDLNDIETYFIQYYNSALKGYNIRLEGGSTGKQAESTKLKISKANKGQKLTKEQYNKMVKAMGKGKNNINYGRKRSLETKLKQSLNKKKFYKNKENRKLWSEMNSGSKNPASVPIRLIYKDGTIENFSYLREPIVKYGINEITIQVLRTLKPNQIWIPRLKKFQNSKFYGCKLIRLKPNFKKRQKKQSF